VQWWGSADDAGRERRQDEERLRRIAAPIDDRIARARTAAGPAGSGRERVRRRLALAAALSMADSAQSPRITSTDAWDYKRDRHREGAAWEQQWLEQILGQDATGRRALLTNCGMAAISTVLAFVERHGGDGPLVVDENAYHETRHLLLTGSMRDRVEVVSSELVAERAREIGAAVVFADAVSNTREVRIADLEALATCARLLVVDTSVCSMRAEMVRALLRSTSLRSRARVVLVESLTKHAQLGLDRVTAGVIVASEQDADVLDHLRELLGTNIADCACLLLPSPDAGAIDGRLARIARNASVIARALAGAGVAVCHPSLASHPDHGRWRRFAPACSVLTVAADAPMEEWLAAADACGVPLDHGAGFGFDVTRVYRTTRTVPEASEFVRISPGTEPIDVATAVAELVSARWLL
jgi:cystathionine beta-lyase/cystathionine gamma-synthase